jgi:putative hydrolase of the HAD superfamily
MAYSTLFFDLDGTLYPAENGLWDAIKHRMSLYMADIIGIPGDVVPSLRSHYYQTYGTTLRGLQIHYQVNPDDYLHFVHDLPLEEYLTPAPELRVLLNSLKQKRWIFTNADAEHAKRVLRCLEIEGCFDGVIDIWSIDYACKPDIIAYQSALRIAGESNPENCVLFEDSAENLKPAHKMGFTTILVGQDNKNNGAVDLHVPDISRLRESFPDLWAE